MLHERDLAFSPSGPARRRPAGTREIYYPQVRNGAITVIPEST